MVEIWLQRPLLGAVEKPLSVETPRTAALLPEVTPWKRRTRELCANDVHTAALPHLPPNARDQRGSRPLTLDVTFPGLKLLLGTLGALSGPRDSVYSFSK